MKKIIITITLLATIVSGSAQEKLTNKKGGKYEFTVLKDIEATSVKSQDRTGTCWSWSALSFIESEVIRMGGPKVDLSPMYVVRNSYIGKGVNYLRMYGNFNFGPGGAFHDIPWAIKRYGIVPIEAYEGLDYGQAKHNHSEMNGMLEAMLKVLKEKPQKDKLTSNWKKAYTEVVDAYLGDLPDNTEDFKFKFDGKEYNPNSFTKFLGLNMDDYISLTSYTHHPFYSSFMLEVPDNWAMQQCYNLPLDEFMDVMESAVNNGYSFAWGADVSEKGFSFRDGLAIVPADESTIKLRGRDNKHFSDAGAEKIANCFDEPVDEKVITQKMRQNAYDNQTTTDDHGMHITGLVKDQNGDKYFIVKNSWGDDRNDCDGYFYASYPYMRYKTMNIMIHKDAISKDIRKKLGL